MTAAELLATIVAHLDAAGIAHMLAGSMASSFHGEPRSTQDIDLVIDPDPQSLARFVEGLDQRRFYVSDARCWGCGGPRLISTRACGRCRQSA